MKYSSNINFSLTNLKNPFEVDIDARRYVMGVILMHGGNFVFYHS
jgi:hypothetical protein